MEQKYNTKQIIIYLLITFGLTYSIEIFLIRPMVGSTDIAQAYFAQIMVAAVMFLPAVGALVTRLATKEKFTKENLMISLR